jgi:hypothetical protein
MPTAGTGFGRRTPARNAPLPHANPGPAQPAGTGPAEPDGPCLVDLLTSRGVKQIGGVLVGVAIVFAVITLYVNGMKSAGRALDRQWAENAGYPTLDQQPTRANAPATEDKVRNACLARAKGAGLNRAMDRALDYFTNIRVGENQIEQHAAFINCLVTEQPSRLCQAEHSSHLAGALRDYFRLQRRVREEWMMARSPMSATSAGLAPWPGRQGVSTQYPSERTDPRIVNGLKSLIVAGYLTPADLGAGWFSRMPGDLDEQLKGVEAKKRSCG